MVTKNTQNRRNNIIVNEVFKKNIFFSTSNIKNSGDVVEKIIIQPLVYDRQNIHLSFVFDQ